MLPTSCFTLEDDEDLDLDEAFLFSTEHQLAIDQNKEGNKDRVRDQSTTDSTESCRERAEVYFCRTNGFQRSLGSSNGKHMSSQGEATYPPAKRMSSCGVKSSSENEWRRFEQDISISSSTGRSAQLHHHSEANEQTRSSDVSLVDSFVRNGEVNGDSKALENGDNSSVLRKFPGPAGIFPRLGRNCDQRVVETHGDKTCSTLNSHREVLHCSTFSTYDADFNSSSWLAMCEQLKISNSVSSSDSATMSPLLDYTVASALKQAANCDLPCGKIPYLRVFVKSLTHSGTQASAVLKDPTGEMMGTIHGRVLEQYGSSLSNGATVVLKQVSVFSPSCPRHYLNITLPNIVHVFPAGQSVNSPLGYTAETLQK
ncbi:uncharacterized protein LOC134193110 isoform X2 [Corticium candelabrum]|uniref:uncharacterized protein LOC134193110 isoform X2 n=1 Tax=Corticium candelabrum TaxID=121492 RepID=UPI002E25E9BF|nr:uncharacterized protein LOC134193110 isoform X2 [Corticium candelabrum]